MIPTKKKVNYLLRIGTQSNEHYSKKMPPPIARATTITLLVKLRDAHLKPVQEMLCILYSEHSTAHHSTADVVVKKRTKTISKYKVALCQHKDTHTSRAPTVATLPSFARRALGRLVISSKDKAPPWYNHFRT